MKWLKDKAGWIVTALLSAIIVQSVVFWRGQVETKVEYDQETVEKKKRYFDNYCYTVRATVRDEVTNGAVYIDYDIMKLPPAPDNNYELHAYIGNASGIIIANSQTNIHPAGVWGPTQYAKDWEDNTRVNFKGSGFTVPKHLPNGDYTVVIIMVFYADGERHQCQMPPIPFKLNRDYEENIINN